MSKFITIDGLQSGLEITKTYIDDSIPTKVSELKGDELISNDKEFNIVDNNGYVAVSINKDGLHTAKLTVNGKSLDTYIEGQTMISITYDELKTLRDSSSLIPGQHYRIVDYITTTTQTDTKSAGKPFDIIVIADSNNVLNEKARAIQRYGNTYFSNSNLAAWQIWYCLDNDTTKFAWADETNGKGVIYRMIDEFDNDCGYDFKNIQFKRYKVTSTVIDVTVIQDYYIGFKPYDDYNLNSMKNLEVNESEFRYIYTFNDSSYNDLSMNNSTNCCFSNHISRYKNKFKNNICTLNNVVIYNSLGEITLYKFDDDCKAMSVFSADASTFMNHFGQFSKGNVLFSANFGQNKFLDNFTLCTIISELSMQENYISEYAQHNTILVKRFSNNDIGTRFTYNTINNFNEDVGFNRIKDYVQNNNITCRFMSNDIGHNFMNNEITSRFTTNKVGDNFKNNYCAGIINSDFKVMCQYNTFGSITACTIGSGFRYNTFKKASDANSTTIKNCTFGDYVWYNNFYNNASTDSDLIQCLNVQSNLQGTETAMNNISVPLNSDHEIKVAKNSAGVIKVYCEADLIA